ncbi:MAG: CBS domain-containing protein [Clostridia bacterium]|nr:CBS domain-containing protein [Clostridia bacterium]
MNAAYYLTPRSEVGFLYDDFTVRQGLEKLKRSGFAALPVVTRKNQYIGTVTEGDFLWYLVKGEEQNATKSLQDLESVTVRDVLHIDRNPPLRITASVSELVLSAMNQNFVPIIDDLGSFIGIVTRKDIIRHFYLSNTEKETG